MKKHWQILEPDIHSVEQVRSVLNCSIVTASVLVNRNIVSAYDAILFLNSSLKNIRPPFSIKDMDAAVRRIYTAITNHEKILIFGDYDVDGITATTILLKFFHYVGADVSYHIPHRTKEGYSLKVNHIFDHALPNKINLIITVDCGSGSHDAVKAAQDAGIDVIITDHHEISDRLPQAVAVVNPKRHDCTAGFDNLAGVGVAFYLLICLRKHLRDMHFWHNRPEPNLKSLCDLVALGTIADIVPLVDENRILTRSGLNIINSNNRPGIEALMKTCKINKDFADTDDIAFRLAPRLNAPGRIDHARTAVELLTTKNVDTAMQIAQFLNQLNTKRQDIEKKILEQVLEYIEEYPHILKKNVLVFSYERWHEGILGIVASRIVKRCFRPVVLISTKNGVGKGSARSIPGFNIYKGLLACSSCLENFGGHSMAAGLKIKTENISLFQKSLEKAVQEMTEPADFVPKIFIDYELEFDEITNRLIDELESLMPFGTGNPEPLFMARNVRVLSSKIVGKNHRRMRLSQPSSRTDKIFNAIHFNVDTSIPFKKNFDQVAFRLNWNRWNGKKTVQLVIEET